MAPRAREPRRRQGAQGPGMSGERAAGARELPRGAERGCLRAAERGPRKAADEASGEQRLLRLRRGVGRQGVPGARTGSGAAAWGSRASAGGVGLEARTRGAGRGQGARGTDAGLAGTATYLFVGYPLRLLQAKRAAEGTVLGHHAQAAGGAHQLLGVAARGHLGGHDAASALARRAHTDPRPAKSPAPPFEADSARAQSPSPARSTSQSALGLRPISVLANPRKGTAPATLWSVTNRQWGPARARSTPLGAIWTLDWPVRPRRRRCFLSDWRIRREALSAHWKRRSRGAERANSERTPGGSCGAAGPGRRRGRGGQGVGGMVTWEALATAEPGRGLVGSSC